MTPYTPIHLSKIIEAKCPEVETDMYHWIVTATGEELGIGLKSLRKDWTMVRTYRLDGVVLAIKVHGENNVVECIYCDHVTECVRALTDAYLEDGLQFGEKCEEVIKEIFEV